MKKETKDLIKEKMMHLAAVGRELIGLAREQRCTLVAHDLEKFQSITTKIAVKAQEWGDLQLNIIDLMDGAELPADEEFDILKKELSRYAQELEKENTGSMELIRNSLQISSKVLDILMPGSNSVYGGKGSLVNGKQESIVLNKTV